MIEDSDVAWRDAGELRAEADASGGVLALAFFSHEGLAGACTIEGLSEGDARLLAELFARYAPAQLNPAPAASFEEWLRRTPVPGIGWRGELAQALDADRAQALLTAMVYLGAPILGTGERPRAWLDAPVVTQVAWLAQAARTA